MPASVDQEADADVLAGLIFEVEAPSGLNHQRRGVGGFLAHLHDATAQFARRPQRVGQVQVVVG
jgi:Ser/Thr protein kinase RdoA (MazF antagonist)